MRHKCSFKIWEYLLGVQGPESLFLDSINLFLTPTDSHLNWIYWPVKNPFKGEYFFVSEGGEDLFWVYFYFWEVWIFLPQALELLNLIFLQAGFTDLLFLPQSCSLGIRWIIAVNNLLLLSETMQTNQNHTRQRINGIPHGQTLTFLRTCNQRLQQDTLFHLWVYCMWARCLTKLHLV